MQMFNGTYCWKSSSLQAYKGLVFHFTQKWFHWRCLLGLLPSGLNPQARKIACVRLCLLLMHQSFSPLPKLLEVRVGKCFIVEWIPHGWSMNIFAPMKKTLGSPSQWFKSLSYEDRLCTFMHITHVPKHFAFTQIVWGKDWKRLYSGMDSSWLINEYICTNEEDFGGVGPSGPTVV
jgi:hypothetical protein